MGAGNAGIAANGFIVAKAALHEAFDSYGHLTGLLEIRVIGEPDAFEQRLKEYNIPNKKVAKCEKLTLMIIYPSQNRRC